MHDTLTHVLRKAKARYNLGGGGEKINHLLFMDKLKLYGKSENEIKGIVSTVELIRYYNSVLKSVV